MSAEVSFEVEVVDGEGIPVPALEVGARYGYPEAPRTWSSEYTDGEGCARFRDSHIECPIEVRLFVGDDECGSFALADGAHIVLEM
ncbi:MAG: hypothetical protein ACC658_02920 [Acidimicrobiia bacterium]